MRHTPRFASHVRTERIFTVSMPASSMACDVSSMTSLPASTSTLGRPSSSSSCGSMTSSSATQPTMRSRSGSMMSSPSFSADISRPRIVPQSSSVIVTSCATSTSRRVKYPASAVFNAVSARPLRAPCVEMKYSSTDSPSRKFDLIGLSMISPMPPVSFFCGFAIRPRIPASCRIWSREPRLPEGDLAGRIRPLESLDARFRVVQQRRLLARNLEVGDADRDTADRGVAETKLLQLIEELHRRREPRAAVALEHELGEILLPHHLVLKAHIAQQSHRDDAVEDHASRRRGDPATRQIRALVPHLHRRVELEPLDGEPHLQLGHRADAGRRLELR